MIKCPNSECGFENVDGTQFCEVCGEELIEASAGAPAGATVKCGQCGALNPPDNLACEACGAILAGHHAPAAAPAVPAAVTPFDAAIATPSATPLATPEPVPAPPVAPPVFELTPLPPGNLKPGSIKLVVEQGQTVGAQFVLGDPEILVGREDEEEEIYPDVDLSDQDAGYVHRRHATLEFVDGNLLVTHLGGANKTRINNRPIPDHSPQPVGVGDKIAFGKVVVRVLAI